jgi:pantoate--beta-alanine ligase
MIMNILKDIVTLKKYIFSAKSNLQKIGFVPTMGALHAGHISLITTAKAKNDVVICSIFVNPTQFNNPTDLEKYPKTLEADIDKLEEAGCDVLFLPTVQEMYPSSEINKHYNLGYLETILEGQYRPGHFQGVCIIVDKLLSALTPHILYLGKKDYQQCMVIKKMIEIEKHEVVVQICETVRETDGLAMSSRNMRLNNQERQQALCIIQSLNIVKANIKIGSLQHLKLQATNFLIQHGYKVDYVEIANTQTLVLKNEWDGIDELVVLVAAYLNDVRLIDNIVL